MTILETDRLRNKWNYYLQRCWKEKKDPWRTGVCAGSLCGHWAGSANQCKLEYNNFTGMKAKTCIWNSNRSEGTGNEDVHLTPPTSSLQGCLVLQVRWFDCPGFICVLQSLPGCFLIFVAVLEGLLALLHSSLVFLSPLNGLTSSLRKKEHLPPCFLLPSHVF